MKKDSLQEQFVKFSTANTSPEVSELTHSIFILDEVMNL
jgi:hypothetical protein